MGIQAYIKHNVDFFYLDTRPLLSEHGQLSLPMAAQITLWNEAEGVFAFCFFKCHWMVTMCVVVSFLFSMEGSWV